MDQTNIVDVIFSFMLVNLFNSSGTLIGVTDKAELTNHKRKCPRMKQVLYINSIRSVMDSLADTSTVTTYVDSLWRLLLLAILTWVRRL